MKISLGALGGLALLGAVLGSGAAQAGEVFGGAYAHGLGTKQPKKGADFMLGYRTDRIDFLKYIGKPSVHVMVSGNTDVPTDFAVIGLNWPLTMHWISDRTYIRPGIGFAYTTGEADVGNSSQPGISAFESQRRAHIAATRIDFGSKELFEPELAFGYRINDQLSAELSYVHLSNGQILHQGKNQGLDDIGLRVNYRFGGR